LSAYHLVGDRSGPLHVVILVDLSGSFDAFSSFRQTALDRVLAWAPGNLRDDDLVTVVAFASSARTVFGPAAVGDLGTATVTLSGSGLGRGTLILPALREAAEAAQTVPAGMPAGLIALTDTMIDNAEESKVGAYLGQLGVSTVSVVEPAGLGVSSPWGAAFPGTAAFEAATADADATAVAVGQALAHATGQVLAAGPA
jgi:hypothetical protein